MESLLFKSRTAHGRQDAPPACARHVLILSLCRWHDFRIDNLCRLRHLSSIVRIWRIRMLDLVFLCLGLGGFALMAVYAALCDRL
jgi:hypothetical protein